MILTSLSRFFSNFNLWRCPLCDTLQYGPFYPVCPLCIRKIPLYPDTDIHDNAIIRLVWPACDVKAGGALFHYDHTDEAHQLIYLIKYYGARRLAESLGEWICKKLRMKEWEEQIDAVVPVPMNKRRRKEYGYNQVAYVAKGIAKCLGCNVEEWLVRNDTLSSQTRLNVEERQQRVMDIAVRMPDEVRGRTILLVDDVMTTGATMRQCAAALQAFDSQARICVCVIGCVLPSNKSPKYEPQVTE